MTILFSDSLLEDIQSEFETSYIYHGLSLSTVIKEFKIYEEDFTIAKDKTLLICLGNNDTILSFEFEILVKKFIGMLEKINIKKMYMLIPRKYALGENFCDEVKDVTFLEFFDGDKDDYELLKSDKTHLNHLGCKQMCEFIKKNIK